VQTSPWQGCHVGRELEAVPKPLSIFDALAWLVLCATLAVVCATFRDYGVPWDAQGEAVYGELLLKFYRSWFRDRSAFEFVNLRFYGGGFELPAALLARVSPFDLYETRHLFNALLGIVGLAGTWRLARALGGPRTGALAALLLASIPSWYGHTFINARDVPFAAGIVWCLVFTLRALDELPRIRIRTSASFGLALGLTMSVRVGGVIGLFFLLAPLALWLVARARAGVTLGRLGRDGAGIAASVLIALVVAYVAMVAFWPWALESPLNPLRALLMFSSFPFDAGVLFEGKVIPATMLPASYLPVQLALRLPELVLIGVLSASLLGVLALSSRPSRLLELASLRVFAVVVAAALPIAYSMLARPVDYNGLRHFLFVLPPLVVLAALAFDRALQATAPRTTRATLLVGLIGAAVLQTRAMIALHPDEYVYFNSLASGTRGAQDNFELDYWGISLAEATHRLTDHLANQHDVPDVGEAPYKVYVCGNVWSAATFFPPWLSAVERIEDAQFQIAIENHFCKHAAGSKRLLGVFRSGALLSYVEDLRNRSGRTPQQPGLADPTQHGQALWRPPELDDRAAARPAGPVPQRVTRWRATE
jgi:hypothetical protein